MFQPRNEERRPRRKGGAPKTNRANGGNAIVLVPAQRRPHDACWRCGVPFALTTSEVLRRCAELAREAA